LSENKALELGASGIELDARADAVEYYQHKGYVKSGTVFPSKKTGLPHQTMIKSLKLV
jgi:predicted GNAT family N-acyltransferase